MSSKTWRLELLLFSFFFGVLWIPTMAHAEAELAAVDAAPAAEKELDVSRDLARGTDLLTAGKEDEAFIAFADFLRRYPQDTLAPEAQYNIGEINFRKRQFELALADYRKVFLLGPQNSRIADASIRMGECLQKLGRTEEARIEWEAVKRKFSNTEAAHRAEILVASLTPPRGSAP